MLHNVDKDNEILASNGTRKRTNTDYTLSSPHHGDNIMLIWPSVDRKFTERKSARQRPDTPAFISLVTVSQKYNQQKECWKYLVNKEKHEFIKQYLD